MFNERSHNFPVVQKTMTGDMDNRRKQAASAENIQNNQFEEPNFQDGESDLTSQADNFDSLNILSQAILEEAFEEIRNRSIIPSLAIHETPKAVGSYGEIIRRVLKRDHYGQYLSPREYSAFKRQLSGDKYSGIGMHISQESSGSIIAEPMTGSPAERAGIKNGDKIIAINAKPIHGRTLIEVSSRIRGTLGSSVDITFQRKNTPAETVTIRREQFLERSVSQGQFEEYDNYFVTGLSQHTYLHISSFDQQTDDQFYRIMSQIPETMPIVLDLRGNSGGNFRIAMKIAESFLAPQTVLCFVISRDSAEIVQSLKGPKFKNSVTIIQDSRTASAAESFIAAMVENKRAVSLGEKSFGKARLQSFTELSDGSAMLLTTAKLLTPSQYDFDKIGIAPSKPIPSKS